MKRHAIPQSRPTCESDIIVRQCLRVKGAELLRRLRRLAHRRGWACAWHPGLGKDSHGKLFMNGRQTTLCDLKREVKAGSLHGMLRQLGISVADLFED